MALLDDIDSLLGPMQGKASEEKAETPTPPAEDSWVVEGKEKEGEEVKVEDGKEGEERPKEEAREQEQEPPKPKEEEGVEEPPKKEEVEKVDPIALKDKEIEELRNQLREFAEKATIPPPQQKAPEQKEGEKVEEKKEEQAAPILPFIRDEQVFDEVFKSHQNFNALLTAVVNTAREQALRSIPMITQQLVERQMTLKMVTAEFFDHNKDLLPYRKFLGIVANEIEAAHPDYTIDQVLAETEKEGRKRLRLMKDAQGAPGPTETTRKKEENPGFVPGGGGGRKASGSPLTGQEKDIFDLISDM